MDESAAGVLRDEMRRFISLGFYDPYEIIKQLERLHGPEWVEDHGRALCNPHAALRSEAAKQLAYVRRRQDRETAAQKRGREERRAQEIEALGLPPDAPAFSVFWAKFDAEMKVYRERVITEFVTDLLIPQALPDGKWKRRYDLTYDDCIAIAENYGKTAATEAGMMAAFSHFADAIREQSVDCLGEVDFSRSTPLIAA